MTPTPLEALLERDWDGMLFRSKDCLAKQTGWTSYHTLRSKGSQPGYPDRTLVRERIIFAELKKHGGKPTDTQIGWLDLLAKAGGEVYLWRPTDLDEITLILGRRWSFVPHRLADGADFGSAPPHLAHFERGSFVPGSIWVPGLGRADECGLADAA